MFGWSCARTRVLHTRAAALLHACVSVAFPPEQQTRFICITTLEIPGAVSMAAENRLFTFETREA